MVTLKYKQPRGFSTFFLTEMWERYGFYVIQTLLVFYLTKHLHLSDKYSYVIVGSFTALAYINCIFGGLIADYLTNYDSTVILGAILLIIGYLILSIATNIHILTGGLALISVGTGLLKPNVSSMLSILYHNDDVRKDPGYTLYYVGIYSGAIIGSFFGGYLQAWFGWSSAFISSSLGSLLALGIFVAGKAQFKLFDPRKSNLTLGKHLNAILSVAVLITLSYFVLQSEFLSLLYLLLVAIFCLAFLLYAIALHQGSQRRRLIAFLFLIILSILYWAIYFQQFFSISLCTERACKLNVPYSSIPAIESLGVIVFGPLLNYIWFYFKDKGKNISIATKFSLSFAFNSCCFLLLSGGLWYATKINSYLNIWFVVFAYLLIAIGELCISPTSLAMVTSLVPPQLTSAMMGISLLSIGFGGKLAGLLASNASLNQEKHSILKIHSVYMNSFFNYFLISVVTFIVAILLVKHINNLINE